MPNVSRRRAADVIAGALSLTALLWSCWPDHDRFRPVSAAPTPPVRAALGCWRFDKGAKHLGDRVPNGSVFQLDSVQDRWTERYALRVLPLESVDARSVRVSGWGIDASDDKRILMFIGDGFTGISLRLQLGDSALSGTVRGYADTPTFSFRHSVHARLVACPIGGAITLGDSRVSTRRPMKE